MVLCASERPTAIAVAPEPARLADTAPAVAFARITEDTVAATVTPPVVVVTNAAPVTEASTLVAIVLSVHRAPTEAVSALAPGAATAPAPARTRAVIAELSAARISTPVPAEIEPPVTVAFAC